MRAFFTDRIFPIIGIKFRQKSGTEKHKSLFYGFSATSRHCMQDLFNRRLDQRQAVGR